MRNKRSLAIKSPTFSLISLINDNKKKIRKKRHTLGESTYVTNSYTV